MWAAATRPLARQHELPLLWPLRVEVAPCKGGNHGWVELLLWQEPTPTCCVS